MNALSTTTNDTVAYAAPEGPLGSRPPGSGANQTRFLASRTAHAESAPALGEAHDASGISSPFSPSGVTWNNEPHVTNGFAGVAGSPHSKGAVRTGTSRVFASTPVGSATDDASAPSKENTIPRVTSASSLASRIEGGVATGRPALWSKPRRAVLDASFAGESVASAKAAPSDVERAPGSTSVVGAEARRAEVSSGAAAGVASAVRRRTAASAAPSPARPERRISASGTGPHQAARSPSASSEEGPGA